MSDLMQFESELAAWDGKSVEFVRGLHSRYGSDPDYVDRLVEAVCRPELQLGASWLLKHILEEGARLSDEQTCRVLDALPQLDGWPVRLHALQSLPMLAIPTSRTHVLERFLRDNLNSSRPFVRAWAYNGLDVLARQHPHFADDAHALLDAALTDEAPSVKARIRHILKQRS